MCRTFLLLVASGCILYMVAIFQDGLQWPLLLVVTLLCGTSHGAAELLYVTRRMPQKWRKISHFQRLEEVLQLPFWTLFNQLLYWKPPCEQLYGVDRVVRNWNLLQSSHVSDLGSRPSRPNQVSDDCSPSWPLECRFVKTLSLNHPAKVLWPRETETIKGHFFKTLSLKRLVVKSQGC